MLYGKLPHIHQKNNVIRGTNKLITKTGLTTEISTPVKEDLDAKANSLLDQIFAAEAKRPPVFEEITKLKTEYDAIQTKRAAKLNQQQ